MPLHAHTRASTADVVTHTGNAAAAEDYVCYHLQQQHRQQQQKKRRKKAEAATKAAASVQLKLTGHAISALGKYITQHNYTIRCPHNHTRMRTHVYYCRFTHTGHMLNIYIACLYVFIDFDCTINSSDALSDVYFHTKTDGYNYLTHIQSERILWMLRDAISESPAER